MLSPFSFAISLFLLFQEQCKKREATSTALSKRPTFNDVISEFRANEQRRLFV